MRWVRAAVTVTVAVGTASVFTAASSDPPAVHAQGRPDCSNGPANALDQIGGTLLGDIWPDWLPNPYEPESPDEVWDRCIRPYLDFPPPRGGPGRNSGDPHIVTQDGATYDFHGAGDFVLLRSAVNDVELQVRYRRFGQVSLFNGVAIRVGDTTLTVERFVRDEPPLVTLDGVELQLSDVGWHDLGIGFVMRADQTVFVELANGIVLEATRPGLTLLTPVEWAGTFEGIQGNGDGDPTDDVATADGSLVNPADTEAIYGEFFDSWYIAPAGSLFTIPFDEQLDGPIRPDEFVTIADLDPAAVADAERTCLDAGLTAGIRLEHCVFDVAVTGDPFWAESALPAAELTSVPAVAFEPDVEDVIALGATGVVAPDVPEAGAGKLGRRFAADDFTIAEFAAGTRSLRVTEPCSRGVGPVAVLIDDGEPTESLHLVCRARYPLPSTAFALRVIDPTGGEPDYGFEITQADVTDLGLLVDGAEYRGEVRSAGAVVGRLPYDSGSRAFVAALDDADCTVDVRIVDAGGAAQGLTRAGCLDVGPIDLTGTAPFSIELSGDPAGDYHFTVTEVAGDTVSSAQLGQRVDLEVSTPGQQASTTIDLTTGDRVYVETIDHIGGRLVAIGPDGTELRSVLSINDLGLLQATTDGTHTITIRPDDANTGTQQLTIHTVADDTTTPATPDTEIPLTI
ncbi:MAG: VWD domain-containing protein, partial [Ilumatobacter sp.]|uniref:VWD domain-containing protein n=1 Tax=Ilumatobacter sp. TaxID=1967498 RepID=UPI00261067AF